MKNLLYIMTALMLMSFSGKEKEKTLIITTKFGTIKVRLYNETPQHRDNYVKLAQEHFFDSLLFHRVIKGFMIQGGDPDSKHAKPGEQLGEGGLKYTIPAEIQPNLFHKCGVIAAARDNNPQKASSSCQFYIAVGKVYTDAQLDQMEQQMGKKFTDEQRKAYTTIGGIPHLDGSYTVFGEVYEGMNVVDSIIKQPTDHNDRPLTDIRMEIKLGKDYKVKKK
jgi:cyclophilin family peptidyl-prolyl cis-trans isomerase